MAFAASGALAVIAAMAGCDTISSDFAQFTDSFTPPTPQEAAQWAADPNDAENARRGTVLLANAPWGGSDAYLRLYRLYAEDAPDPLVRAAAVQALGRHGEPEDAARVAKNLASPYRQVRLASAKALQRLHDPAVADTIWTRLIDPTEDSDVRTELAVALGQYPTPAVFNALVAALSQRDLAVNAAAVDALRTLTGQRFGLEEDAWLRFYASTGEPFAAATSGSRVYLYPVFSRQLDTWDYLLFWDPVVFEASDVPIGLRTAGIRRTSEPRPAEIAPITLPESPSGDAKDAGGGTER